MWRAMFSARITPRVASLCGLLYASRDPSANHGAPILEGNPALVEKLDTTMRGRLQHTAAVFDATREEIQRVEVQDPLAVRIRRFFGLAGRR